jgi:hypothetical protein
MKTYGMNDTVYYKLTSKGREIWEKENEELKRRIPFLVWKIDYYFEDWIKDTLWSCFARFGKDAYNGNEISIYDITFDDPLKDAELSRRNTASLTDGAGR